MLGRGDRMIGARAEQRDDVLAPWVVLSCHEQVNDGLHTSNHRRKHIRWPQGVH